MIINGQELIGPNDNDFNDNLPMYEIGVHSVLTSPEYGWVLEHLARLVLLFLVFILMFLIWLYNSVDIFLNFLLTFSSIQTLN